MRVFVLCTGRCGSTTFARACQHISNYTAAHESKQNSGLVGDERITYPDNHIEVDNRLIWWAGNLHKKYSDAFYVHLMRDEHLTAVSRVRNHTVVENGRARPMNFTGAYVQYVQFIRPASMSVYLTCALDMVNNINENIRCFLRDKPHVDVHIENPDKAFAEMWQRIGAIGHWDDAVVELKRRHHKTEGSAPVELKDKLGELRRTTAPLG